MGVKIELSREEFVSKLVFHKVHRKMIPFTQIFNQSDIQRNTFFICNAFEPIPLTVITRGDDETTSIVSVVKQDEVILIGPNGEHYIIAMRDFFKEYNVNEGIATPRKDIFASIAHLTEDFMEKHFDDPNTIVDFGVIQFESGDYIARNCDGGLYKIDTTTFDNMYVVPKEMNKKKTPKLKKKNNHS